MIADRSPALLLLFLCILLCMPSREQTNPPRYSITNYNSDNALPQNSINAMAFDKNGFLWLATKMGIVRFDGKNFREYNAENSPALSGNEFSMPQPMPERNKMYFKPVYGAHILRVTADYRIERDSPLSAVPYKFTTSNNHLFYFTNIYKKQVLEQKAVKYKELLERLDRSKGLITINEKQAYFTAGNEGYFLDDHSGSIIRLPEITGHTLKLQFAVGNIFLYVDDQHKMFAYKDGMLQKNIIPGKTLSQLFVPVAKTDPNPVQASLKIRRDAHHTLMLCQQTILLLRFAGNVLHADTLAADVPVKDIKCMIYDEGYQTLYIGTITSGLYLLRIHEFERLFFTGSRFMINSQCAQIELPDGNILTSTGILSRSNKNNRQFADKQVVDILALLKTSDGSIWYSKSDSLKKTDGLLRSAIALHPLNGWLTGIVERENKNILYSTSHQLFSWNGIKDTVLFDNPVLMQQEDIQTIRQISKNTIWIGTTKGLYAYDLSKHRLNKIPALNNVYVTIIHLAKDSSIWIGSYGQGFYKWDKNSFVKMPLDPGKSLVTAHCFMEDKHGYFWIPSNRGLFRVTKKELDNYAAGSRENVYYYYIDKYHGFTSNEFNSACTPCGIVTKDGRFSLPSLDGLVQFHPDSVHISLPDKPILIEYVTAGDKKVLLTDRLTMNQDSNRLVFEISSPYFGSPRNLQLEYSIKELNDKWYPVDENGRLILTQLSKGEYTLVVRKQSSYAHYTYKSIRLTILPWWYETTWFRYLAGGLAIGAFLLFFRVRYNFQVKRAEKLEQKVAERTAQLSLLVNELEQTNEDLHTAKLNLSESNRVKEIMISIILHDLRSPLRFLNILAQRIHSTFKKLTEKELEEILFQFRSATNDLHNFAHNFFVFTNTQKDGFVVGQECIVLREITNDIITLYEAGANIHKNTFINLVPEHMTLNTDANMLKLIMRNLADNANKFTHEGEIKIEAIQCSSTTRIMISDTGISMEKELIERILRKTYNPTNASQGWGYKIITELLMKLNGTLTIDTGNSRGNTITITFENA
jgi:signal transduction histidine kinase